MEEHSLVIHLPEGSVLAALMLKVAGTDDLLNPFSLSVLVMTFLVGLAWLAGRSLKAEPGFLQNLFEVAVDFLRGIAQGLMGEKADKYLGLFATLFLFILCANLIGLIPGLDSPTANVNINLGMALIVVFAYHYTGIRTAGLGYVQHFLAPPDLPMAARVVLSPLFMVIEGLGLFLIRPTTLTLRLFGNIKGKEILLGILAGLVANALVGHGLIQYLMGGGFFVLRFMILVLGVLVSLIQAAVFTILTMIYIGLASAGHDDHGGGHEAPAH